MSARNRFRALALVLVATTTLTSCAYVEFSRKYEVSGFPSSEAIEPIVTFFTGYFRDKGLTLKRSYAEVFPNKVRYLVFELPRSPHEKRRNSYVLTTIYRDRRVTLEHNEWFLQSANPYASMQAHQPNDFIEGIKQDLEKSLEQKFGSGVRMTFLSKSHY